MRVCTVAKSAYTNFMSLRPSAHLHVPAWLQLDVCRRNLILGTSKKICLEDFILDKTGQKYRALCEYRTLMYVCPFLVGDWFLFYTEWTHTSTFSTHKVK